jgi:glycosyltransferase involved in cell wall biosynthesis
MEKPTVSTTVGAEGLDVKNGEDILLADTPADFAHAVVRIFNEPALAHDIGARAARAVRERYSWDNVAAEFDLICENLNDNQAKAHG